MLLTCVNISAILEIFVLFSGPKSTCISILEAPTTVFGCDYVMYDVELQLHWVGITVLCPAISVKESTEKLKDLGPF